MYRTPLAQWRDQVLAAGQAGMLLAHANPAAGGLIEDAAAREFVARLLQERLSSFPGAAHAIHAAQLAQLTAAIREFLTTEAA